MTILGANRNEETLPPAHEPDERGVAVRGIQAIWTICREPRLLLGVLGIALLLVLVALWVPQMPSQLQSNPAAANRWLLDISRELGRGGDILRALGIFNLLSSPLFRTLLLTAAFLLAIQVADQLGVLLALRQLPAALQEPVKQAGDPLVLPPALVPAQQDIVWAQHLVLMFPLWLGDMPALMKAFLEQVARPGLAGAVRAEGAMPPKALAGRSARIVVTMGMPALAYRWVFRAHSVKSLERNILGILGVAPVHETLIGGVAGFRADDVARWCRTLGRLGADAA